tara:strand:+ start:117 stop:572 length:456 start_codon:yes stop_codon:yes gene_type:complete
MNDMPFNLKQEVERILDSKVERLSSLLSNNESTPIKIAYVLYNTLTEICTFFKINNVVNTKKEQDGLKMAFACFFYSGIYTLETKFYDVPEKQEFMEELKTNFANLSGLPDEVKEDLDNIMQSDEDEEDEDDDDDIGNDGYGWNDDYEHNF